MSLRVIAGELKGRKLRSASGLRTRPTAERTREAIFNILGSTVQQAHVLDLFAGTGAYGIEALSRGAASVLFIEVDRQACVVLTGNIQTCGMADKARVLRWDASRNLNCLRTHGVPGWYHFKHTIPHQGAFVHRRLFERIGGFREQFSIAMDYDFFYRAFRDRATIRYFHRPVSRMGGYGISSQRQVLLKRLDEEKQVQELNERSLWWRTAQKAFRSLYLPYKTRCLKRPRPTDVRAEPRFPS